MYLYHRLYKIIWPISQGYVPCNIGNLSKQLWCRRRPQWLQAKKGKFQYLFDWVHCFILLYLHLAYYQKLWCERKSSKMANTCETIFHCLGLPLLLCSCLRQIKWFFESNFGNWTDVLGNELIQLLCIQWPRKHHL